MRFNRQNSPYPALLEQVNDLMAGGMSRLEATEQVAAQGGVKAKTLREACDRKGIGSDAPRKERPRAHIQGRDGGAIVKEAQHLLDLAERAAGEIDGLRATLRTKDGQISRLQRELERGKEVQELETLQARFREVSRNLEKRLPALALPGGDGHAA